jgi:catechol 2,3-dioxygenase-like lactoylglutathione lyase family enzyme
LGGRQVSLLKESTMLGNQNVMAFVATADAARARPFYEGMLGLTVKRTDPFAVTFDVNGIELRITTIRDFKPAPYSVLSWVVADIKGFLAALAAKGVVFEKYGFPDQDESGIWTAPDGTKVAWFKDPDGNVLSLTEFLGG